MKIFIAFLLIFVSFSDAKPFGTNNTIITVQDPPSPTINVTVNVTWTINSGSSVTNVVMVVKNLQSAQWAAVGLGQNQNMGEAHVFMCKRLANDTIVINRYINPKHHHDPEPAGSEQGGVLTLGQQTLIDGVVTCQFNLSNFSTTIFEGLKDLNPLSPSEKYHPLFAIGLLDTTNDKPKRHSEDSRTALAKTVQLNRNEIILYRINSDNNITME